MERRPGPRGGLALAVLGLLAALATGCGNGGSTSASETGKGYWKGGTYYPPGPTRQFVIPGGDNTIQYFGREGTAAEREEASRVIAAWMRARSAKDWPVFCRYMSRRYLANLVTDARRTSKGKAKNCVQAMVFFGAVATNGFVNTMTGPIASLRVSGDEGYAQYHGIHHVDWIVPVASEATGWKVGVSAPIERTK